MSNQVYVGNLNYEATRKDVSDFFEQAGLAVTHVNMAIDRETGKNKSFAFVEFPTESDANNAISSLDGKDLMGREVKVKPAERRNNPRDGASSSPARGSGNTWRAAGAAGGASQQSPQNPGRSFASGNWRLRAPPVESEAPAAQASSSNSVYLGGVPNITSNDDAEAFVREVMQSQGFAVRSVSRMFRPNPEQASRHPNGGTLYCFVELESVEEANSAMIKLDGLEIEGGGRLKCNVSKGGNPGGNRQGGPRSGFGGRVPAAQEA